MRVGIVKGDINALLQDFDLELDAGGDPDRLLDQILILPVDPTRLVCRANDVVVEKADGSSWCRRDARAAQSGMPSSLRRWGDCDAC